MLEKNTDLTLAISTHTKHYLLLEFVSDAIKIDSTGIFSKNLIINADYHNLWEQGSANFTAFWG